MSQRRETSPQRYPIPPLAFPVTVQLRKGGSPLCLESTFVNADAVKNESGQFTAKR